MNRDLTTIDDDILRHRHIVDRILETRWGGVRNPADLDDLYSAGLIGLERAIASADDGPRQRRVRYLESCVYRAMVDRWREGRISWRKPVPRPGLYPDMAGFVAPDPDPGVSVERREEILAALARMTPRERECALMVWHLGLPAEDVASALRITTDAVYYHLRKARSIGARLQATWQA